MRNYKFTGKELDGSGLYYFGARYYDKSLGRFLSTDLVLNLSGIWKRKMRMIKTMMNKICIKGENNVRRILFK